MSALKKFKNKLPSHKKKREFIVYFLSSTILISIIFVYTYIKNSPINPDKFPVINLVTEEDITYDDYIDGTFELNCPDEDEDVSPINCKIKIRGKYNKELPKKGYRIELSESISLLGMREDDDWMLFAMYSDLPRMQIKLAMELYRTLYTSNPTAILPESRYVIVYVNRDLQGLYLLVEKNDRRLFGLDDAINSIQSSLIFQSSYAHKNFKVYLNEDWEQDWPNEYEDIYIMDPIMIELLSFIKDSSHQEFFNAASGIYSKFNKQNLIDFYVYNFFILHDDFWDHNYFIVRNTNPSKFFLVPWDFDRCFGQWLRRNSAYDNNDEVFIRENNLLFQRLLDNDEFRKDCKTRWFNLRDTIWTEAAIMDMLMDFYEEIKDVLDIDTNLWYHNLWEENWEEEIDEAIEHVFNWIPERLVFCDYYFSTF